MSHPESQCPYCGSSQTASRRQLFRGLMDGAPLGGSFSWYGEEQPQALPPKSLFIVMLALMLAAALPATGLWLLGHYFALRWLALFALLLLAGLLLDVTMTWRRYKSWDGERLCGECRAVFK